MFVIVETADVELIKLHVYSTRKAAVAAFERIADKNHVHAITWNSADVGLLANEISGTIAIAGDDAYSVQLIERTEC